MRRGLDWLGSRAAALDGFAEVVVAAHDHFVAGHQPFVTEPRDFILTLHEAATVATTARGENAELVRSLGADVVVDYTKDDFAEVLAGYVSGTRVRPVRRL